MSRRRRTELAWLVIAWPIVVEVALAAKPQTQAAAGEHTLTIHWRQVPLRDAITRFEAVFEENVFLDRRVDPSQRVSLDIEAARSDDVLAAIAEPRGLGISRLGRLIYMGPLAAAQQLAPLAASRSAEIARLPDGERAQLTGQRPLDWPRLTEPRALMTSLLQRRGWHLAQAEKVPHDLWPADKLPALSTAEQLTVLLIGFDLTFEVRIGDRALRIVPLGPATREQRTANTQPRETARPRGRPLSKRNNVAGTKQLYTLRVVEQPVRAVLGELSQRVDWRVDVDEAAIRAAGLTLDERVSFTVENAEADELLDALLRPAGLTFRRKGERIMVVPQTTQ